MNKAQLIDAMALSTGLSKEESEKALDAFVDVTTDVLKMDERLALVGFGSFGIKERQARAGHNPQTGKEITIKAKKVVKFKEGSDLSGQIQQK